MNDVLLQQEVEHPAKHTSYIHEVFDKSEQILRNSDASVTKKPQISSLKINRPDKEDRLWHFY